MKANKWEFFPIPLHKHLSLLLILIMANLAFSQGLSKKCVDELLNVSSKKNFDLQSFLAKDLPAEVVKVKAQMKLPFGKPKDDKVTDIGVTVGCLKGFPENVGQIQTMLKDVSLEMAKRGANKLGANALSGASAGGIAASIGSGIIVAKASSTPALKECDAVFNTDKKFCHDGGVYDKCDGVVYNPSTHICTGDVAYRAVCNGVQYNPLTQKCENNAIYATCGDTEYNPTTHNCKENALFEFPKCGETAYNPETHGCNINAVLPKCGAYLYFPSSQGCGEDNKVYPKCGANLYNSQTHICENNAVVPKQALVEEYEDEYEEDEYEEYEKEESERKIFSLGFRAGLNSSHIYQSYNGNSGSSDDKIGFNVGLVFDFAANGWFHFQPGIMYIQKGAYYRGYDETIHCIEFPILVSLKSSALRFNVGPYFSLPADFGISYGLGFDIGNFYIGVFYDYGLTNNGISDYYFDGISLYDISNRNRTLGFTLGYNL